MAAGEARAAWQRTANRCFVQEDAKRAPKLACCPPSPSKLQPDQCPGDAGNGVDSSNTLFVPFNWNTAGNNLSPNTKWWLKLQPNFGSQRDIIFEQLKALNTELDHDGRRDADTNSPFDTTLDSQASDVDHTTISGPRLKSHCKFSASSSFKHQLEVKAEDLKSPQVVQLPKHEMTSNDQIKEEISDKLMDFNPLEDITFDQAGRSLAGNPMPWASEKAGPWWQAVDRDELASFVAHNSSHQIENFDLLLPPYAQEGGVQSRGFEGCSDKEKLNSPSFDHKDQLASCKDTEHLQNNLVSRMTTKIDVLSTEVETSLRSLDNFSSNSSEGNNARCGRSACNCEVDASKATLLEALCHSQMRARKAEKSAQRAHLEKEHIIKLFFKQSTHLFAYKQLFRLLQLENVCLQLRCNNNLRVQWDQISALFPWLSPSRRQQGGEQCCNSRNKKRKRDGIHIPNVGNLHLQLAWVLLVLGFS